MPTAFLFKWKKVQKFFSRDYWYSYNALFPIYPKLQIFLGLLSKNSYCYAKYWYSGDKCYNVVSDHMSGDINCLTIEGLFH
jgi:hypothetical protein